VARLRVVAPGARIRADADGVHVPGTSEATVLIAEATDYDRFAGRHTSDPPAATEHDRRHVADRSLAELAAPTKRISARGSTGCRCA